MNLDKRLEKVKQKRKRKNFMEYAIIGGGFLALILIIVLIAVGTKSCGKNENPEEVPAETQMTPAETVPATESPEEIEKKTSGTTIINIKFKKKSPKGFKIVAFSPIMSPTIAPTAIDKRSIMAER